MEDFIKFNCEKCGFKVKTKKENKRKKGRCPSCKTECIIPEPEYTISDIEKDLAEIGQGKSLYDSNWDTSEGKI